MKRACVLIALLTLLGTGCGDNGGSTAPADLNFTSPTNASLEAIDCARQRAYVPVPTSGKTDAEVEVLDLSVDPNVTDPRLKTIDLGHGGVARGVAIAPKQGLALTISGDPSATGFVDEINESDNTLVDGSPFPFPTGSEPEPSDGIVFDPLNGIALISMTSTPAECPGGSVTACSGMAKFDPAVNTFSSLIQFNDPVVNFGLDPGTLISLAPSDVTDPIPYAIDLEGGRACTLTDDSMISLDGDAEGAAVDPDTGIWVIGNFADARTTVINLHGASFSGSVGPCQLDEFGAPPSNSINFDSRTGDYLPGVAINPQTHEAFLTGKLTNTVVLMSLPNNPVKYIGPSDVKSTSARLPAEPDGLQFEASILPYSDTIATCNDRAYVVNAARTFMAEIDLARLRSNPGAIGTPLPAGTCAGTTTTLGCDNQNGVRFFPL